MGQDKALLRLAGRPLHRALPWTSFAPYPSLPHRASRPRAPICRLTPQVVADLHPGCGPLSGIEAALAATTQPLNLFLPVDIPLLAGAVSRLDAVARGDHRRSHDRSPHQRAAPAPVCHLPSESAAAHTRIAARWQLQSDAAVTTATGQPTIDRCLRCRTRGLGQSGIAWPVRSSTLSAGSITATRLRIWRR